jgi:hypothetical protein
MKTLKNKLNEQPVVVNYQGPYEGFEFETNARRMLAAKLANRLVAHGLTFGDLTYTSRKDGLQLTSGGRVNSITKIKYKLEIVGSTKTIYWEVEYDSSTRVGDVSNIVIDGVAMKLSTFYRLCELKTALLFI